MKEDEEEEEGKNGENDDNEEKPEQPSENDESNAKETNEPEMEIEGIVQGEADNNVVQSASRINATYDEDNKV